MPFSARNVAVFGKILCFLCLAGCALHTPTEIQNEAQSQAQDEGILWLVKGPYFMGSTEILTDPEGQDLVFRETFKEHQIKSKLNRVSLPALDKVELQSPQESWVQWTAEASIDVKEAGPYLIFAPGVTEFDWEGKLFPGEFWNSPHPSTGFQLEPGRYSVKLRIAGLNPRSFGFELRRVESEYLVSEEMDSDFRPLANSTEVVRALRIWNLSQKSFDPKTLDHPLIQASLSKLGRMPPTSSARIAYATKLEPKEAQTEPIPYRVGFMSKLDESPQHFAILEPKNYQASKKYALILTLHGAHMQAIEHLKTMKAKDWAFVVAPTNRGPQGLGWNDLGREDALEVLDIMMKNYPIDPTQIYLSGHSMGAQGALHLALHRPELFAAISLQAPWIEQDLYIPTNFSFSDLSANSQLKAIRDLLRQDYRHTHLLKRLKEIPVLISTAKSDPVVPPMQSRLLYRWLAFAGAQVELIEHEQSDHFCRGEESSERGYLCTDFIEQSTFFQKHRKQTQRNPVPHEFKNRWLQFFSEPFLIVVDSPDALNLGLYIQRVVMKTSGAFAPILEWPVDENELRSRNILFLGSIDSYSKWPSSVQASAIIFSGSEINVGSAKIPTTRSYGAWVLRPSAYDPKRFMAFGLSSEKASLMKLRLWNRFLSRLGQSQPDFIIFDQEFSRLEWDSVLAAGFFSEAWDLQSKDLYIRP